MKGSDSSFHGDTKRLVEYVYILKWPEGLNRSPECRTENYYPDAFRMSDSGLSTL